MAAPEEENVTGVTALKNALVNNIDTVETKDSKNSLDDEYCLNHTSSVGSAPPIEVIENADDRIVPVCTSKQESDNGKKYEIKNILKTVRQKSLSKKPNLDFNKLTDELKEAFRVSLKGPANLSLDSEELTKLLLPNIELQKVEYKKYSHITWYVSNAKQSAYYYIYCFGFQLIAFKGLETGSRDTCSYVVQNHDVKFEFVSPLRNKFKTNEVFDMNVKEINRFIEKHGDGVRDVAFEVDDVDKIFEVAVQNKAKIIERPHDIICKYDHGKVRLAKIVVFGDTVHTLINKKNFRGTFLPNYHNVGSDPDEGRMFESSFSGIFYCLPEVDLLEIDHCVQNQSWNKMVPSCRQYAETLGFKRFWSVDENDVSTEYSSLRSIVMSSCNEKIKMPINEPAKGLFKSQIEEFVDFYDGPGVQHIALRTEDIIKTISNLRKRGCEFISVPPRYYKNLKERLKSSKVIIEQSFEMIEENGILVDFDDNGYLLQLFTKPLTPRPTVFIEIIYRNNHNGFGAGNFKALFDTIEQEQKARGNLTNGSLE